MMDLMNENLKLGEDDTIQDKGIEIGCQNGLLDFKFKMSQFDFTQD
jgi:hypothetical protein